MSAEDVVRAKRFELVDDNNNVRASLGTDENGTGLIFSTEGGVHASIGISSEGLPVIGVHGSDDQSARLQLNPDGGVALAFQDSKGHKRVTLGMLQDDANPGLTITDATGRAVAAIGHNNNNQRFLSLFDPEGKPRATIQVESEGPAVVAIQDQDGNIKNHIV